MTLDELHRDLTKKLDDQHRHADDQFSSVRDRIDENRETLTVRLNGLKDELVNHEAADQKEFSAIKQELAITNVIRKRFWAIIIAIGGLIGGIAALGELFLHMLHSK